MSVSEKQSIFTQIEVISDSLNFVKDNLKSLSIEEETYTVSFLRDLIPKIDSIQCKVKACLHDQKDAIKGIDSIELIVLAGKLQNIMKIFRPISSQLTAPALPEKESFSLFDKSVKEIVDARQSSDKAEAKPEFLKELAEVNERWVKLIQQENTQVADWLEKCEELERFSDEDCLKIFFKIESHYLGMKSTFKAPFWLPSNELKIKEKLKHLESLMQKIIDDHQMEKGAKVMQKCLTQSMQLKYPSPEIDENIPSLLDDMSIDI